MRQIIAKDLPVKDILNICTSSKTMQKMCEDDGFWRVLTIRDFSYDQPSEEELGNGWRQIYKQLYLNYPISGVLLSEAEGSGRVFKEGDMPAYFLVRITKSMDPDVQVGEIVFLHPDKYVGSKLNYGQRISIRKIYKSAHMPNPATATGEPQLRIIQAIKK